MTAIEEVAGISLITPDRLENLVRAVLRTSGLPGDMAELGVYRGGSAKVICEARPGVALHLFDTFSGLPWNEERSMDPQSFLRKGNFGCPEMNVRKYLEGYPVTFNKGIFPQSTEILHGQHFSFVHVDCDLYRSAADAIKWFWPRMNKGGIMFFDDYGCLFTGVTKAVDEGFRAEVIEKQYDQYGNQIGALVVM